MDSLFSTSVTTFIPPHNTYDQLTLDFLQEFGFNCISAKQINFDAPMDIRLDIRYLWFTTADIEEFKKIVKLKHYIKAPTQVLALHHTNFTSDGIIDKDKIDSYEQLLKYIVDNNISNYTFSNFPKNEISNDELYYKVAYQYLLMKYGNILASKFIRLCEFISPLILVLFVLLSFVLFIYSLTFCVLDLLNFKYNSFARKSILIVLAFAFSWLLFSLYNAYSISVYNIYYILFSLKILLQLSLLSVMIAVYEISFKRKTI